MATLLTKNGTEVLVDDDLIDELQQYVWNINYGGYPYRHVYRGKGKRSKRQTLHSFVLEKRKGYVIDHIDRNKLNNQRSNLRYYTYAENARNRTKLPSRSQYKGVQFKNDLFEANIVYNFKPIHIGLFPREDLAGAAYDLWAMDLDPAYVLNFPEGSEIHTEILEYLDDTKRSKYRNKRSITGYKGVTWDSSKNKYVARITFKGRRYKLGFNTSARICAEYYDIAERLMYPNRIRVNFYSEEFNHETVITKVQRILETVGPEDDKVVINKAYKPEPTGFKGVSKYGDKYSVRIYHNKEVFHLGYFNTAEEAAQVYNDNVERIKGVSVIKNQI